MARNQRIIELIRGLEKERSSRVLVYFTGDRQGRETQIADDCVELIHKHLESFGSVSKIDLFIYTRGGIIFVPWKLVSLIRSFTQRFAALIPYRCHSAGTMIALGADEIVMCRMGELSPVDPQFANPASVGERKSVEDVMSYISFAKEKVGIRGQAELGKVLDKLVTEKITALDIGSVHRAHNLIRYYVKRLLESHEKKIRKDRRIEVISGIMTEKLHAHEYTICRREAREMGLNVAVFGEKESKVEGLMWNLYLEYQKEMHLRSIWNPIAELAATENEKSIEQIRAVIESKKLTHHFVTKMNVRRAPRQLNINAPPQIPREFIQPIIHQVAQQIAPGGELGVVQELTFEGWIEVE